MTIGYLIDSRPFCSMTMMTIGPPIPEIQFGLENSRSKVKVKGTPVSAASSWLLSFVFHIKASYRLSSLSFHDNWPSHSRDRIWPWKFKVKVQLTHFLCVSHHGHPIDSRHLRSMTIGSPIPEIPFDLENPRSNVKVKGQGLVDSFPSCFTSGHPIDSCPFRSKTIGRPIPEIPFDLKNSRSTVKVTG